MTRLKNAIATVTATLVMVIGFNTATVIPASADITGIEMGPHITASHKMISPAFLPIGFNAGAFILPDGYPAWCIDPAKDSPVGTEIMDDPELVTAWQNAQGDWLTADQLAQMAYVMAVYGGSDGRALTDLEAAAIFFALRHLAGYTEVPMTFVEAIGGGGFSVHELQVSYQLTDVDSFGSIMTKAAAADDVLYDRALEIALDAVANFSLWDGTHTRKVLSESVLAVGDVFSAQWTFPGIRSGKELIVTLTHPDGTTTQHTVITDANDQALFEYTVPVDAAGEYSVTAEMSILATTIAMATYPVVAEAQNASVQAIMLGVAPQPTGWQDDVQLRTSPNAGATTVVVTTGGSLDSGSSWLLVTVLVAGLALTGSAVARTHRQRS